MPMVRFERYVEQRPNLTIVGEDDGVELPAEEIHGAPIFINPLYVAAIFGSSHRPDATIVRLADGRGLIVRGEAEAVNVALDAAMPQDALAAE